MYCLKAVCSRVLRLCVTAFGIRDSVGAAVGDSVRVAVGVAVSVAVGDSVRLAVSSSVGAEIPFGSP